MDNLIGFIVKLGVVVIAISVVGRIVSSLLWGLFGIFNGVVYLGVMIFFVIYLVKQLSRVGKKPASKRKKTTSPRSGLLSFLSEAEFSEMNRSLREFFRLNDRLVIKDELYLRPKNGEFKNMDDLELWYFGEAVATLATMSAEHRAKCEEIMDFLKGKPQTFSHGGALSKEEREKSRAELYIEKIDAVNSGISDPAITEGLHQTTALLRAIHEMEMKNSESEKLRKLYDHYLPILMSTLIRFMNLGNAPLSRDYTDTKSKLTETVALINEALYNITSDYYGGEMTDINIDARTLQSILKKDGVVGTGFVFPERLDEMADEEEQLRSEVLQR